MERKEQGLEAEGKGDRQKTPATGATGGGFQGGGVKTHRGKLLRFWLKGPEMQGAGQTTDAFLKSTQVNVLCDHATRTRKKRS